MKNKQTSNRTWILNVLYLEKNNNLRLLCLDNCEYKVSVEHVLKEAQKTLQIFQNEKIIQRNSYTETLIAIYFSKIDVNITN